MSLLRQLTLAILTLLLLVWVGSVAISVANTRRYLDRQLESHAQDAATSLGLSLSTSVEQDDRATMESLIDAMFDSGYYRSIRVLDTAGTPVIERTQTSSPQDVPSWFVRQLPVKTPLGEALLMSGWKRLGTIEVRSDPGYAYLELWGTFRDSAALFALVAALALVGAMGGVRIILKPLRGVEAQATAIANRDFPVQEQLPRTPELRRVVEAMNRLSGKVQQMLAEQITLAETLRAQAYRDPVTGLGNRALFDRETAHLLSSQELHFRGALLLIQLREFRAYNEQHGYAGGDELLRQAGDALRAEAAAFHPYCVARLSGADFAMLLPRTSSDDLAALGEALAALLSRLHDGGLLSAFDGGHVGIALHCEGDTPGSLLSRADAALRQAQTDGGNAWRLAPTTEEVRARSASAWRELLTTSLQQNQWRLFAQPVRRLNGSGTTLHHEILLRLPTDEGLLSAADFMPMAYRHGLATQVDKTVIDAVLDQWPTAGPADLRVAINLSAISLTDVSFHAWLLQTLDRHPDRASRLTFEVPEYGAALHLPALRTLITELARRGSGVGLDHFGRGFNPFGYLAGIKPSYLKVDGRYVHSLPQDADSHFFIRTLREVAHGLDCLIIAEAVENADQLRAIEELRVDAAQGHHLATPEPWPQLPG